MLLLSFVSQTPSSSQLLDAPVTTGAIFLALTGAITYLYRARDKDRDSEHARLIRTIEELTDELREIRNPTQKETDR